MVILSSKFVSVPIQCHSRFGEESKKIAYSKLLSQGVMTSLIVNTTTYTNS